MPGKPFRSKLEPYYDAIVSKRRARMTWEEIAAWINADLIDKGQEPTTRQNVHDFFKRRRRKRYALGMEPDEPKHTPIKAPVLPAFPTTEPDPLSVEVPEELPATFFKINKPNQKA